MKSPFPGMDPYLEPSWGDVHTSLATYARDQLNKQMPAGLKPGVHESVAVEVDDPSDDEIVTYFPDVTVGTVPRGKSTGGLATATAAEPVLLARRPEPATLRSVWIVTADGGKLVTVIEFLSPSNKIGKSGRDAYRNKQADFLKAKVSMVEIDLIRAGRHLAVRLLGIPRRFRTGYKILVTRGWKRRQSEFYPPSMRTPLPTIKIPLAVRGNNRSGGRHPHRS